MSERPDRDLAEFVEANMPDLTLGTNLFYGPIRAPAGQMGKNAVFCTARPGNQPERDLAKSSEMLRTNVIVTIRHGTFEAGSLWAVDIHQLIQAARIGGYQDVRNLSSEPGFSSYSDSALLIWNWAVEMTYERKPTNVLVSS